VKGYVRSTICDLQRNQVYPIPNILCEILQDPNFSTVEDVRTYYGEEHREVINEYFSFLVEQELIFFTKSPKSFPALSLQWHNPSCITNAILDIGFPVAYDVKKVLCQLDELGCRKIEIRSYDRMTPTIFSDLLNTTTESVFNSIGIVTRFAPDVSEQAWQQLCDNHPRITSIIVHDSPDSKEITSNTLLTPIKFVGMQISGAHCCGVIHPDYFTSLMEPVSEAHHYNSCLNRKIGIDLEGNIKNCPSMAQSFGHVSNSTLAEIVHQSDFQRVWHIAKDEVDICRDCEFRYVCTDCRAYLENPQDEFSKPLKCGYNPYTGEWEEWSTNPLKQQAIRYYGISEMPGLFANPGPSKSL